MIHQNAGIQGWMSVAEEEVVSQVEWAVARSKTDKGQVREDHLETRMPNGPGGSPELVAAWGEQNRIVIAP